MRGGTLFDPGLQPERTSLAWRRTALSIAVGAIVSLHFLPAYFGHPLWITPGILGVLAAAAVWTITQRRFAAFAHSSHADLPRWGAMHLLVMTLLALSVGGLGMVIVLSSAAL